MNLIYSQNGLFIFNKVFQHANKSQTVYISSKISEYLENIPISKDNNYNIIKLRSLIDSLTSKNKLKKISNQTTNNNKTGYNTERQYFYNHTEKSFVDKGEESNLLYQTPTNMLFFNSKYVNPSQNIFYNYNICGNNVLIPTFNTKICSKQQIKNKYPIRSRFIKEN